MALKLHLPRRMKTSFFWPILWNVTIWGWGSALFLSFPCSIIHPAPFSSPSFPVPSFFSSLRLTLNIEKDHLLLRSWCAQPSVAYLFHVSTLDWFSCTPFVLRATGAGESYLDAWVYQKMMLCCFKSIILFIFVSHSEACVDLCFENMTVNNSPYSTSTPLLIKKKKPLKVIFPVNFKRVMISWFLWSKYWFEVYWQSNI